MQIPLTTFQMMMLPTIRQLVAGKAWLPVSYVMAHVRIESGWNPTIVSTDGEGSVGLMQVVPGTVQQMLADGLITAAQVDQTGPANSLATGIAYIGWCRAYLMHAWGFGNSILYHPVCEAYNEGVGNVVAGRLDDTYFLKWSAAQASYAFVDER